MLAAATAASAVSTALTAVAASHVDPASGCADAAASLPTAVNENADNAGVGASLPKTAKRRTGERRAKPRRSASDAAASLASLRAAVATQETRVEQLRAQQAERAAVLAALESHRLRGIGAPHPSVLIADWRRQAREEANAGANSDGTSHEKSHIINGNNPPADAGDDDAAYEDDFEEPDPAS